MELPFGDGDEPPKSPERPLGQKVLLVDDAPAVRDYFGRLFGPEHHLSVTAVDTPGKALAQLRQEPFDLLVVDRAFGGMRGTPLVAEARKLRPKLEALVVTNYPSASPLMDAFAAGASDYLLKPFNDTGLIRAKVKAALETRKARLDVRKRLRSTSRSIIDRIAKGQDASEDAWDLLELKLREYDGNVRAGALGTVAVCGSDSALGLLQVTGMYAAGFEPGAPELESADVVVLETSLPSWQTLAEKLSGKSPHVVLLASAQADVADLLDALALRLELVGFGQGTEVALVDRVKTVLTMRTIHKGQLFLLDAMRRFSRSLRKRVRRVRAK